MVVSSPTWPPLSPPSAMKADAPSRVISFAIATEATTGMTLEFGLFPSIHVFGGVTRACGYNFYFFFYHNLRNIIRKGTQQHDVDADRL